MRADGLARGARRQKCRRESDLSRVVMIFSAYPSTCSFSLILRRRIFDDIARSSRPRERNDDVSKCARRRPSTFFAARPCSRLHEISKSAAIKKSDTYVRVCLSSMLDPVCALEFYGTPFSTFSRRSRRRSVSLKMEFKFHKAD